jgi:hypothetical protein
MPSRVIIGVLAAIGAMFRAVAKADACRKRNGAPGAAGANGATGSPGPRGDAGLRSERGSAATLEESLTSTIDKQTRTVTELTGKITGLTNLPETVAGINTNVNKLTGELSTTETKLKTELENGLKGVEGQVNGVQSTVEGQVSGVQSTVKQTCEGLKTVTAQSNVLSTTLGTLTETLNVGALLSLLGGKKLPTAPGTISSFECK